MMQRDERIKTRFMRQAFVARDRLAGQGSNMKVIKIIGLYDGTATPLDGKYLKEYDPMRDGSFNGEVTIAHIAVVEDPLDAMQFADAGEALELWRRNGRGLRPDGQPQRPLTAFTVEVLDAPARP